MAGIVINQGTQSSIYVKDNAGTSVQVVKLDIGSGTELADFGGTINRVTDLLKGTITSVGTVPGVGTLTNVGSVTNLGLCCFVGEACSSVRVMAGGAFQGHGAIS